MSNTTYVSYKLKWLIANKLQIISVLNVFVSKNSYCFLIKCLSDEMLKSSAGLVAGKK